MALTGLQIQKLLPKTNCKECGCNTCLAFAMKLAAKKADLSECPYASEEARKVLGAAGEPPVRGVAFGPRRTLVLGEETVLYRHEKTFVHQTALAIAVRDTDPSEEVETTLARMRDYVQERVGESIRLDMVAVCQRGRDVSAFVALARRAHEATGLPLVLCSPDPQALAAAATAVKGSHSLLASATPETADALWPVAKDNEHALALTGATLDDVASLAARLRETGCKDLVLQLPTHSLAEAFQANSIVRRGALRNGLKALGYPTLAFIDTGNRLQDTVAAVTEISKYGGICVLPSFDPAQLTALMTLRLNLYTDPQKPIQVDPRLYPIGEPTPQSPVFVTTNFSLTYFIVSGEIENAGISAWLLVPECEGMSVLTAWAAGKFSGSSVAKFAKEIDLDNQVASRQIIIPGYVAQISGELEENMPGWNVLVGPQEAADLESFIKARLKTP
ncbi:MAG: acetyl-CoA decarbonylase/synthase complex subunit gamma [Lentisphaeria bacterium]|nr:acetyl-CoA decarbonylase/synthase complex subunit gamma [Lentisphaeria bacterium]